MDYYIYNDDLFCADCRESIETEILREGNGPEADCRRCKHKFTITKENYDYNFSDWINCPECGDYTAAVSWDDSDNWPVIASCNSTESDSPNHCGECGEFLENDLTPDGDEYVAQAIRENPEGENEKLWSEFYDIPHYSFEVAGLNY